MEPTESAAEINPICNDSISSTESNEHEQNEPPDLGEKTRCSEIAVGVVGNSQTTTDEFTRDVEEYRPGDNKGFFGKDDCCICFDFELDWADEYPDQKCRNRKCKKKYHTSCLLEWLTSIPSTETKYKKLRSTLCGTIYGTCIYCYRDLWLRLE